MERDPYGLALHQPGAKADAGKVSASLLADFSLALLEVGKVCTFGAAKYSRGGWQQVPNAADRYADAAWRHLLAARHESHDSDSGLLHEAHQVWCHLARLELKLRAQVDVGGHSGPADASPQHEARDHSDAGKPTSTTFTKEW